MKRHSLSTTIAPIALEIPPLLLAVVVGTAFANEKTSVDQLMHTLSAVHPIKQIVISPDGTQVALVEAAGIYVTDLKSSAAPPFRVSAASDGGAHTEQDVAWSSDGKRLAFLSDAEKEGQLELHVARASVGDHGPARRLTHLTGFLTQPSWSPDGKEVAFLFTENAPRAAGPLEPMTRDAGVVEQHVYEQRLTTVDLATGDVRQLSPANLYVYEYDWSPDGKTFVATAAHGAGDNNWYVAELYTIDANSGDTRSIFKPSLQIAAPRWSPDGRRIAFIGGLMSDEGSTGGDIFTVPATGGEARNLTPGMNASASWLTWLPSSNQILFTEIVDGTSGVATVDPGGSKITTLWTGPEAIRTGSFESDISVSGDGKSAAVIRSSFQSPPEGWAGPIGEWKQVTHINPNLSPSWGRALSLHWTNDGMPIQGWLIFPRDYDSSRRYPMIVVVHGGPGGAVLSHWPGPFDLLGAPISSQGYFVLEANPRGSFGRGEAFTQANVKDFGYGDFRDILAGVDEVVKTLPVDSNRIGITGWSYGGFMTMWAVTQTQRFRAAVAGAGLSNWQSYYGENDIDRWMIPFFGASVYDDPAVYAKSSPITFIKSVKTPTLILVGDSDGECPPPQSYEFWHALKTLGVETQLVIYPKEGHLIAQPEHRRDIVERAVAWFDQHLK